MRCFISPIPVYECGLARLRPLISITFQFDYFAFSLRVNKHQYQQILWSPILFDFVMSSRIFLIRAHLPQLGMSCHIRALSDWSDGSQPNTSEYSYEIRTLAMAILTGTITTGVWARSNNISPLFARFDPPTSPFHRLGQMP